MKKVGLLFICIILAMCFLLAPQGVKASVDASLSLCARSLIPALFPFFVLSNFIIKAGLVPPSPMILGMVGGYPLGASVICNLYKEGRVTKRAAEGALCYCSLCGPGFILGAVGGVFNSLSFALILWAVHILTALIIRHFCPKIKAADVTPLPVSASFTVAVRDALFSCLNICALVVFFSLLCDIFPIPPLLSGVLELSRGVFVLPDTSLGMVCAAFYISFGGLCVHAQVVSLCCDAGLSPKRHFFAKLIHGVLSAIFVLFLTFFIL